MLAFLRVFLSALLLLPLLGTEATAAQFTQATNLTVQASAGGGVRLVRTAKDDAFAFWSAQGTKPTPLPADDAFELEFVNSGSAAAVQVLVQFFAGTSPRGAFRPLAPRQPARDTLRIDGLRRLADEARLDGVDGFRLNLRLLGPPGDEGAVGLRAVRGAIGAAAAVDPVARIAAGIADVNRRGREERERLPMRVQVRTVRPLPVVVRGEAHTVDLVLANRTGEELTGDAEFIITDWTQTERRLSLPVNIGPGGETATTLPITDARMGHHEVAVSLTRGGEVWRDSTSFAIIDVIDPPIRGGTDHFVHGICADGFPDDAPAAYGAGLDLLGIDMVRFGIYWERVEPSPGVWTFQEYDRTIANYLARGIDVMGLLAYSPRWAAPQAVRDQPREVWRSHQPDLAAWERYVATVVARYPGVRMWEVWNEPDLTQFFIGTPEQYMEMLRIAHRTIKRIAPHALVTTGGFALAGRHGLKPHPEMQRRVLAEAATQFDVLAHHEHAYFQHFRPALDLLATWRQETASKHPVFFNETATGHADRGQPVQLAKKHVYLRAWGAMGHNWFKYVMSPRGWGMLTTDFEPRMTFPVYRNLRNVLGRMPMQTALDRGYGNLAFAFAETGARTLAGWREEADAGVRVDAVRVPRGVEAIGVTLMGERIPLTVSEGVATYAFGVEPSFVVLRGPAAESAADLPPLISVNGPVLLFPGLPLRVDARVHNPMASTQRFAIGGVEIEVPAGSDRTMQLDLPAPSVTDVPPGGTVRIDLPWRIFPAGFAGTLNLDVSVGCHVPAASRPRRPDVAVATRDGIVNLFENAPGQEAREWAGPADVSFSAWFARRGTTVEVVVEVRDDVHVQPNSGKAIWKGDSLEWGIATADGSRGWRVGAALADDSSVHMAVWNQPTDQPVDPSLLRATVQRRDGVTMYTVSYPFDAFGFAEADLRGGLRMGLLVNDDDGHEREGWASSTTGMGSTFMPTSLPLVRFE